MLRVPQIFLGIIPSYNVLRLFSHLLAILASFLSVLLAVLSNGVLKSTNPKKPCRLSILNKVYPLVFKCVFLFVDMLNRNNLYIVYVSVDEWCLSVIVSESLRVSYSSEALIFQCCFRDYIRERLV